MNKSTLVNPLWDWVVANGFTQYGQGHIVGMIVLCVVDSEIIL
jgi:hypothetical protein